MTGEEYLKLTKETPNVGLVRPYWLGGEYHKKIWTDHNITVLICQRKTRDEIKLCLESLLSFYPDIPVLVVDGDSQDESTLYLKAKSALYPNIKVWERVGLNAHGTTMDEAIQQFITTEYVLLMDSDVITSRYGFIEGMLAQFKEDPKLYATGNLMLVTRKGEACGIPADKTDILRYAHPCCSIYHVPTYKKLRPFENHGAPCATNMIHAEVEGYNIGYYPVDMYTIHLSGSSWCIPKTIWIHDYGVKIRPMITFICQSSVTLYKFERQTVHDFDIVTFGNPVLCEVTTHDSPAKLVNNSTYDIRFNVNGEYICQVSPYDELANNFVERAMIEISNNAADIITIDGINLQKRNVWQRTYVFD